MSGYPGLNPHQVAAIVADHNQARRQGYQSALRTCRAELLRLVAEGRATTAGIMDLGSRWAAQMERLDEVITMPWDAADALRSLEKAP